MRRAGRSAVGIPWGRVRSGPRAAVLAAFCALLGSGLLASASAEPLSVSVAGGDSLGLWILVDWPHPLPDFVQERLQRGIPATVGLRAELWRRRSGWFDAHVASSGREYKVLFDAWKEGFTLLENGARTEVDSLPSLVSFLARERIRLPLQTNWCDGESDYRIAVTTYVRPLTSKDVGEIDAWLRGELRGMGSGVLGLPRGLFSIVRDLSGLGERNNRGSSAEFRLSALGNGRVRVLIPGARAMMESAPQRRMRMGRVFSAPFDPAPSTRSQ